MKPIFPWAVLYWVPVCHQHNLNFQAPLLKTIERLALPKSKESNTKSQAGCCHCLKIFEPKPARDDSEDYSVADPGLRSGGAKKNFGQSHRWSEVELCE